MRKKVGWNFYFPTRNETSFTLCISTLLMQFLWKWGLFASCNFQQALAKGFLAFYFVLWFLCIFNKGLAKSFCNLWNFMCNSTFNFFKVDFLKVHKISNNVLIVHKKFQFFQDFCIYIWFRSSICVCVWFLARSRSYVCVTFVHIFYFYVYIVPQFYSLKFSNFIACLCLCVFRWCESFVCFNFLVEVGTLVFLFSKWRLLCLSMWGILILTCFTMV